MATSADENGEGNPYFRLFDLPVEIRLQIYSLCAQQPRHSKWIFGDQNGMQYSDHAPNNQPRNYPSYLHLRGNGPIAKSLLLTSKRVYDEAIIEIYKRVTVMLEEFPWRCQSHPEYWFGEHPFHFTTRMEIYKSPEIPAPFVGFKIPVRASAEDFVAILNQMPNLLEFDVISFYTGWSLEALRRTNLTLASNTDLYQLFIMKEYLRPQIKYRLRFRGSGLNRLNIAQTVRPERLWREEEVIRLFEGRGWELETNDRQKGYNFTAVTLCPGTVAAVFGGICTEGSIRAKRSGTVLVTRRRPR